MRRLFILYNIMVASIIYDESCEHAKHLLIKKAFCSLKVFVLMNISNQRTRYEHDVQVKIYKILYRGVIKILNFTYYIT